MIKDSNGNELTITQSLHDALILGDSEFSESLVGAEQSSISELLAKMVIYHRAQIASCLQAVGTLESYVRALQEAADIEMVEYTSVQAFLAERKD